MSVSSVLPDRHDLESIISFTFPLAAAPTVNLIPPGGAVPAGCSGTVAAPAANPGNLCVFVGYNSEAGGLDGSYDPEDGVDSGSKFGTVIYLRSDNAGTFEASGTWAVTAP